VAAENEGHDRLDIIGSHTWGCARWWPQNCLVCHQDPCWWCCGSAVLVAGFIRASIINALLARLALSHNVVLQNSPRSTAGGPENIFLKIDAKRFRSSSGPTQYLIWIHMFSPTIRCYTLPRWALIDRTTGEYWSCRAPRRGGHFWPPRLQQDSCFNALAAAQENTIRAQLVATYVSHSPVAGNW